MKLIVVVLGTVLLLIRLQKAGGFVSYNGSRCQQAVFKCSSIDQWFDGRTGLAVRKSDINVAVCCGIKVIFGSDHGNDFSGFGTGDKRGSIANLFPFKFSYFGGDSTLGKFLDGKIQRSGYRQGTVFDHISTKFFNEEIFHPEGKVRSLDAGGGGMGRAARRAASERDRETAGLLK